MQQVFFVWSVSCVTLICGTHLGWQARLAKDLGEGSIPDVSVCRHIKQHNLMTREEVTRLSQARRQELLHQEQRRRQGEIIIRLADLKVM